MCRTSAQSLSHGACAKWGVCYIIDNDAEVDNMYYLICMLLLIRWDSDEISDEKMFNNAFIDG